MELKIVELLLLAWAVAVGTFFAGVWIMITRGVHWLIPLVKESERELEYERRSLLLKKHLLQEGRPALVIRQNGEIEKGFLERIVIDDDDYVSISITDIFPKPEYVYPEYERKWEYVASFCMFQAYSYGVWEVQETPSGKLVIVAAKIPKGRSTGNVSALIVG